MRPTSSLYELENLDGFTSWHATLPLAACLLA